MILLELFWGFLQVGGFSFGGAYGAIPLIQKIAASYGWISDEQLLYIIAISESTPGPIMVNMATYVGSDQAGFWGALVATVAVVLPAFFIILLASTLFKNVFEHKYAQAMLRGVQPCVIGIVMATGAYMLTECCTILSDNELAKGNLAGAIDFQAVVVAVLLVGIMSGVRVLFKKELAPISLIAISACLGIMIYGM